MDDHKTIQSIIELKRVSIRRGSALALDGITWTTCAGQHWFIVGNNGSGKTTLLEVLMGYLWPQEGTVSVLGRRYGRVCLPQLRLKIGYVSTWLFERIQGFCPVRGVVASGAEASVCFWRDIPDRLNREIERVLEEFSAVDLLGKKFGEISSGQQFKVVLARALVNQPAILVLDEPFAWLDMGSRIKAYRLLGRIATQPHAPQILLVTHHLEDIIPIFTHGVIMRAGKFYEKGNREKILSPGTLERGLGIRLARDPD